MNPLRHWKVILCLVAIFVAGAVTGAMVTLRLAKRTIANRQAPEQIVAAVQRDYRARLQLTDEQVQKLRPVFDRAVVDVRRARANTITDLQGILRQANRDIARELTLEQRGRFEELLKERRARLREKLGIHVPQEAPYEKDRP